MLQQFTPLAARLVVAEDDLAPLPPPPEDDIELDNNEDPLFSTEGVWEATWETDYRKFENSQSAIAADAPVEAGAWTIGSDKLILFGRGVDDKEPRSIAMSLGGQRMALRLAACGEASTVLVEGHDVWEWGKHVHQWSGGAGFVPRHPTRLHQLCGRHITSIACGAHHSLALSAQDEVWVWGKGENGQLGLGNWLGCASPTPLAALSGLNIIGIGCGHSHSMAFAGAGGSSGNTLWTWGANVHGQLGHGEDLKLGRRRKVNTPTEVTTLSGSGVVAVAGGTHHSLALLSSDEVWAWGTNDFGQLGIADNCEWPSCASMGPNRRCLLPRCVEDLSGRSVVQISCGSMHSVALTAAGAVFGWGRIGTKEFVTVAPTELIPAPSVTRPQPSPLVHPDTSTKECVDGDPVIGISSSITDIFASSRSGRLLMCRGRALPVQTEGILPPPPLPPPPPGIRPATSSDELGRASYRSVSEGAEEGSDLGEDEEDETDECEEDVNNLQRDEWAPMSISDLKLAAASFQHSNPTGSYDEWLQELGEVDCEDTVQIWEEVPSEREGAADPHVWNEADLGQGRGLVLCGDGCGAAHSVCFSGVSPVRTRSSLALDLGALLSLNVCVDGSVNVGENIAFIDTDDKEGDADDMDFSWLVDLDASSGITIHRAILSMRLPGLAEIITQSCTDEAAENGSKIIIPDVSRSVLVCIVGWAYTAQFPIRKMASHFSDNDRSCRWLLDVLRAAKRFGAPRIEWLCVVELQYRLTSSRSMGQSGQSEKRVALVVDLLIAAESLNITGLKMVMVALISSQFKSLISDHALFVVSRLNSSSHCSNDLLAKLLCLGDMNSQTSRPIANSCLTSLGHYPPLCLDVSMLDLFRRTSYSKKDQNTIIEASTSNTRTNESNNFNSRSTRCQDLRCPDVVLTFSSGLIFTAHSCVLAARSRFFEKALHYHSPTDSKYHLSIVEDEILNPRAPEPLAFVAFLRFLYTGCTRPVEPTHALYLLQVLDFFDLRCPLEAGKLSRACHAAIIKKVDDASALPLLKTAHRLGLSRIRELAFKHVLDHASGCLVSHTSGDEDPIESICSEMPELASALIRALISERDDARSNRNVTLQNDDDDDDD